MRFQRRDILHDEYVFWLPPASCTCPGALKAREEKRERERQEILRERARERQRLLQKSGLPPKYHGATFAAAELIESNRGAFARVRQFAEQPAGGLLVSGPVGTGKTYLAGCVVNHRLDQLRWVMFGNVVTLLGRIKRSYDHFAQEAEWEIINELTAVPVLILDDLGKDRVTPWVEQILYHVVDTRYRENRPLMATTNLDLPELQERYPDVGPALVSRLVEMCQGIRLDGVDWRKRRLG